MSRLKVVFHGDTGLDALRKKLPKNLELHEIGPDGMGYGGGWQVRQKGNYFNWWRPWVWVYYDAEGRITKIVFHTRKSVKVVRQLIPLAISNAEIVTAYKDALEEWEMGDK